MINDLREFLNLLEAKKDLVHISRPTSPRFEIAAGIRKTSDIEGPALLFDNVVGHSMPVVGGLYAVRRRAIWGLQTTPEKFVTQNHRACATAQEKNRRRQFRRIH
jgi:UbiD family decarboxylase